MSSTERAKVIFDATSLRYLHTGLGQFSYQLLTEFEKLQENSFKLFALVHPDYRSLVPPAISVEPASFLRRHSPTFIQKHLFGPCQLWHITTENTRLTAIPESAKVILTIHGLHFLDEPDTRTSEQFAGIQRLIDRANVITAVSGYTANLVREKFDLKNKPLEVLYNGISLSDESPMTPSWAPKGRFIFSIGTFFRRKNFHVLLPMMTHLPGFKLVLAGDHNQEYGAFLLDEINRLRLQGTVIMPGEISPREKVWLYQQGDALVFPSLSEGFGIPVIEACHYGKLPMCSRNGSLPEIGSHHASYWENFEPQSMADKLRKQLEEDNEEKKSARKIYAAQFSWKRTALGFVNLYKQSLNISPQ